MNIRLSILLVVLAFAFTHWPIAAQPAEGKTVMELTRGWKFRQADSSHWMGAVVPGSVHTDLERLGLILHPYYRVNEKSLQWIDKSGWDYATIVHADGETLEKERIELVFEGLDTYAEVYLNEVHILSTDNMFRTYRADVKKILKPGVNNLLVRFKSPTLTGLEKLKEFGFQLAADNDQSETGEMGGDRVSPYVRKAPYHFGWDWGPRLVTSGIWRPVKLVAWDEVKIEDIQINVLDINDKTASLEIKTTLDAAVDRMHSYAIFINGELKISGPLESGTRNPEPGTLEQKSIVTVEDPLLWWPNGMGEQSLYRVRVQVFNKGKIFDAVEVSFGLRTVELVQEADPEGDGRSFYFRVNGLPVFAKGANYIPNDVFLTQVSPEKYEDIIRSAAEANMNMLRVWGGGIYESDLFYDLCDRYGIMVWQDFMFACAMYPGNDEFLENVRIEAVENVRRLRNHPSIVLWCGNNEIEAAWGPYEENRGWGWKQRYTPEQRDIIWKAYDTLFHHILPQVVAQEDSQRPYWHSSPSAGMGKLASYESNSGDMHYWGVWHGQHPFSDFRKYRSRFMSEYGFQSFPEYGTVKKYAPYPEDQDIESEVMMAHQRSGIGNLRIRQYMENDYYVPDEFGQLLYVGQLLQADAIRTAIESHRGEMPYCMGSLYWQLNDVWPVASWSGIDYFGRWKALHYAVREAFKPAVLLVVQNDTTLMINIASDLPDNRPVVAEVRLRDFSGHELWSGTYKREMSSRGVTPVISIPLLELIQKNDPGSILLESKLIIDEDVIDTDIHYFVSPKGLNLQDPSIELECFEEDKAYIVMLRSSSLAKNVFLVAEGFQGRFSNNFFDLLPGSDYAVSFPKESSFESFTGSLKVMHLQMTLP